MSINVIAIAGSHRKNSNTELALQIMSKRLSKIDIETEIITLANKKIEHCRACDNCKRTRKCPINDNLVEIMEKMITAQGIILACPIYSFNITPLMQDLITRGNRYFHILAKSVIKDDFNNPGFTYKNIPYSALKGKVGAAITVARRAGGGMALWNLNNFMLVNEMQVVGSCYENTIFGNERGAIIKDIEGMNNLYRLTDNFGILLKRLFS
ncbi:MAG TPA: hypothetical protein DEG96_06540 [Candidatus Atribacteria bacterium]|nr:hypothetical protein [Candidatus Atribacteria bacterium]